MIFVDTNVFMYAVGPTTPACGTLPGSFFAECVRNETPLCTSAEVVQELMHVYLSVARLRTLDRALALAARARVEIWPLEPEGRDAGQDSSTKQHPALGGPGPLPSREFAVVAVCERCVRSIRRWEPLFGAGAG